MATIDNVTLAVHNLLRWVVLVVGLYAVVRGVSGWIGKRDWTVHDRQAGTFFTIALDLQLLVGFLLYFVFSDLIRAAFQDFGQAMQNPILRFFAVEHLAMMVLAVILAHVGNSMIKRSQTDRKKYVHATVFFSLSLLMIMAAIPWVTRPLLPQL